jgi:hypothetical protein
MMSDKKRTQTDIAEEGAVLSTIVLAYDFAIWPSILRDQLA